MNDLQKILDFVNFILNKEQSGMTLTPKQYNLLLPIVNLKYFKKFYGIEEEYQKNLPIARIAWEISQKVSDTLGRFKVISTEQLINGVMTLPSNYLHVSSIRYNYINNNADCTYTKHVKPIDIVTDAELGDRLANSITGAQLKYPICVFNSNEIHYYPETIQRVEFTYLRKPVEPVYAYTLNTSTDELVYDQANSVQFEYGDNSIYDIAIYLIEMMGVNIKDSTVINYANKVESRGE